MWMTQRVKSCDPRFGSETSLCAPLSYKTLLSSPPPCTTLLSPSLSPSHYSLSNWLGSWVPPLIILSPPLSLTHTLTHVLSLFYSFTDSHTLTDQSTLSPVIPVQVTTSNSSKAACSWPSPGSRTLWSSVFVCPCACLCKGVFCFHIE